MIERGFPDCKDCRGEGSVAEIPERDFTPDVIDLSVSGAEIAAYTVVRVECPACADRRAGIKASEQRRPDWAAIRSIPDLGHWLVANIVEGARFHVPEREWLRLTKPYASGLAQLVMDADPFDRLNENLMGSSWGAWKIDIWHTTGGLMIERHPTGDKRTSVSADRRHLFVKIGDEYVHRDLINSARAVGAFAQQLFGEHNA